MHHLKSLFVIVVIAIVSSSLYAQDATEIIRKMDQKMRGETQKSEVTMTIVRPNWSREVSMKSWSRGTEYSMILITAPARDEGTAFLKRGNEIWNWVPSVGRTIKMPPSMMSQSWMGSDFTNDDLVRESSVITDYEHELVGEEEIDGYVCHKIRMTPKPEAPVVWTHVDVWVSKDDYLQLKTEFYDEFGDLINVMHGMDVKELGGRVIPAKMEMIPQDKEGHKTILETKSAEFNVPIPKDFFSVQNMRRLQ